MKIDRVITYKDENKPILSIFGYNINYELHMYNFNFTRLLNKPCKNSDYENYIYSIGIDNICYRGGIQIYKKKKTTSLCYVGKKSIIVPDKKPCICSESDFTCRFGYMRNEYGQCIPDPDNDTKKFVCTKENAGQIIPSNYEKFDFDKCQIDYKNRFDYETKNKVCMFDERYQVLIVYTKNVLYIMPDIINYDYKHITNFTIKLDKDISNVNIDFQRNCLFAISNQKLYNYCWKYQNDLNNAKLLKMDFVENLIVDSKFDYITRNFYVLETNGRIKVYNFDKNISKYISPEDVFIKKFKFDSYNGLLLFQKKDSNELHKLILIDSSVDKNFLIQCADEYSIDFNSTEIMVYCLTLNKYDLYDFKGNLKNSKIYNFKTPNKMISFYKVVNNIYSINSTSLIITNMPDNKVIVNNLATQESPILNLLYLPEEIQCK